MSAFESPSSWGTAVGAGAGTFVSLQFLPATTGLLASSFLGAAGGSVGALLPQKGSHVQFARKLIAGAAAGFTGSLGAHFLVNSVQILPQNNFVIAATAVPIAYLSSIAIDQVAS